MVDQQNLQKNEYSTLEDQHTIEIDIQLDFMFLLDLFVDIINAEFISGLELFGESGLFFQQPLFHENGMIKSTLR